MSDNANADENIPNSDASSTSELPSAEFIDDLDAALRFKTYLNGRAIDIPADTIEILAALESKYDKHLMQFKEEKDGRSRSSSARRLYQKAFGSWRGT